jgi:FtsP/CotA-like multicopper oxidase with cupredoxin domain
VISRRTLLQLSGAAAVAGSLPSLTQAAAPDYKLEIAPVTLEFSPRHRLRTLAYNGHVPGPLLRLKENQTVTWHSFELRSVGAALTAQGGAATNLSGITKDVLLVDAQTRAEVEFTADNPGATLFHCHQQNHMDLGFMMLFDYA